MSEEKAARRIDQVLAGHYAVRLVRGGPWVAASIEHGEHGWRARINGESCGFPNPDPLFADGVARIWFWGRRIEKAEHDRLLHGKPASPDRPVRMSTLPSIF